MKKFLQYAAIIVLMFGTIIPTLGMDVKAEENADASCTIDYSATLNVLDETQTKNSVMNSFIMKDVTGKKQDGQTTVDITVPKRAAEWYKGFKVKSDGSLKDAVQKVSDEAGNDTYTFNIDGWEGRMEAWVHVDVPAFNYRDKKYTIYLEFSDLKELKKECKEEPTVQVEVAPEPEQSEKPETLEQNKEEVKTEKNPSTEENAVKENNTVKENNKMDKQEKDNSQGNTNGSESGSGQNMNHSNTAGNNNSNIAGIDNTTNNNRNDEQSMNGLYSVDFTFIRGSGSGTSMMDQYVNKPAYVVKNGSTYQVQLTLTNSSWITGFTVNGETPSTVSDANDVRVVQFSVSSLATRHSAWVKVDIPDIDYHHNYNIYLQFHEASLSKINDGTTFPYTGGSSNSGSTNNNRANNNPTNNNSTTNNPTPEGVTANFTQEGVVHFEFSQNAKEITAFLQKANTVFEDNKYKVTLQLNTGNNLRQFIVTQNGKEIAKWSNTVAALASVAQVKPAALSFEVETLDNLVFEAVTTDKTYSTNVKATTTTPTKNEKITRQSITYKMEADPNGKIPDFITNYLAPYFTKAEYVTIDGKPYIEMTLIGKAYGFETLAYIDENGKQQNIEILSSTGEKLDQVRVVRLPLVRDHNGVTKIFVDSGSLGYGAYTLFFTFNVPEVEEEAKNTNTSTDANNANKNIRNPFTDIDNVFSKDEILALYAAGITTGTTATTFSPNRNITRAQFAVMMARALKIQSNKATAFTDVKGKWYEKEVQALAEVGIVRGVNATTFNPNANITRQQAAAMLLRMLEYKGYKVTVDKNALTYKDASNVADYAKQAVSELQAQDIMSGSNGYLNPQHSLTRAQMAKILQRSLQLVNLID